MIKAKRGDIVVQIQDVKPKIVEEVKVPNFILLNEFLQSVRKDNLVETMGGFIEWLKRKKVAKRLSYDAWKILLNEYKNRKV